ncbi:MAG: hypothetical protein KDE51_08040 [Anaerolineales bacterium]|nr:hypothetical protein [Anaerolineales bacterium]
MAKKKKDEQPEAAPLTRREVLRERRETKEKRQIQMIVGGVVGVLALIVLVGIIIEFIVVPGQTVATVNNEEISMRDWQEQVRYQRAQLIVSIEEQYDLFFDDEAEDVDAAEAQAIQTVQQFSQQQISLLTSNYELLGQFVLDRMIENKLVLQGAAERGIAVSEADIDQAIGERFNYFDGGLPTPRPTLTPSPQPTPSLTPVVGVVVEEPAPADGEDEAPLPTNTPPPTATPVSEASFQEQLTEQLDSLESEGADTDLYREEAEMFLYRERLAEALFSEQELPTAEDHISAFLLTFESEEEANNAVQAIAATDFLTVWNTIRSTPPDPEAENPSTARATELLWRTQDQFGNQFTMGQFVPALFELEVGEVSEVIVDAQGNTPVWVIAQVSGREVRELDEFTIQQRQQEALGAWLQEQLDSDGVQIFENWRSRVPRQPALDLKYVQPVQQQPAPTAAG